LIWQAAIEADRQASEPVAASEAYDAIDSFLRNNLGDDDYALYSSALDDVYTAPQPQQQASEPAIYSPPDELPPADDENGRYYETTLRDAVNEAYSSGFSDGRSRDNAPQPQQIPEGYRLVPEKLSARICGKVFAEILNHYREKGQYPPVNLVHQWILEAAPEPKDKT
ncbi:MAG: hypothetical protein CML17_05020, partial [Pusillimonas sp.]|nr:hypothetical protein [Pusillimonas sp.]